MALVTVIGLGRMGSALAYRLQQAGHTVKGFDTQETACQAVARDGISCAPSLRDAVHGAEFIWLMLPAGNVVDEVVAAIQPYGAPDTIIIDGGNSFFKDAQRRAAQLAPQAIAFLDCGVSGGLEGKERGFCLMVGGARQAYERAQPLWHAIAAPDGYAYVGPSGAGHYVKMIHNGIEYALLQSYAEGFHLLKEGSYTLDLEQIAHVWQQSLIRSWILVLVERVIKKMPAHDTVCGAIQEGGTGAWTLQEAHEKNVAVPLIEKAVAVRAWSRETGGDFATQMVALLRHEFGGHAIEQKKKL